MKKSNHYSSDASQSRRLHHTRAYLGVLSEVLPNWPTVRLGEVLRLDLNRVPVDASVSYPMVGVLSFGRGLFEREPIENGKTSYRVFYRLNAEHVVMSQLFGWEGALALSENKYAGRFLSPQFPTFLCNNELLDRNFLGWLMKRPTFWQDLGSRASGMGDRRRTLTPDALFKCEIPLPPLAEQRRIVARIEQLAGQIAAARALRQQAVEEAQVLLANKSASIFDKLGNARLLSEICETTSGGTPSRDRADFYEGNIPWVKSGELEDDIVTSAEEHISEHAIHNSAAKVFRSGTLLVALYGATVGRTGILAMEAATNQAVCAVFPNKEVERDYVWQFLRRMRPIFLENSFGGAQPNISQKILRATSIPVPPLDEQRRIVAELDALQAEVDKLKALQAETAAELDALLPSILDKAFRGEL
jgi:type I restriction enzyme S subunit